MPANGVLANCAHAESMLADNVPVRQGNRIGGLESGRLDSGGPVAWAWASSGQWLDQADGSGLAGIPRQAQSRPRAGLGALTG